MSLEIEEEAYRLYRYRQDHGSIVGNAELDYKVAEKIIKDKIEWLAITDVLLDKHKPFGYRLCLTKGHRLYIQDKDSVYKVNWAFVP